MKIPYTSLKRDINLYEILKVMSDHLLIVELVLLYTSRQTVFTEILKPKRN
jgi:hypothetical protein